MSEQCVLQVEGLTVKYRERVLVENTSFDLRYGETLALVGESGSGKSMTALAILRLAELEQDVAVTRGSVWVRRAGKGGEEKIDLYALSRREIRRVRGRDIGIVFQEPLSALNPVLSVGKQIAEVIRLHGLASSREAAMEEAVKWMEVARIPAARIRAQEYPHQMSGGMRQRVMIAMALAGRPRVLIADEPTTALDVTVQAEILGLINELQQEFGLSVLFITHDMGVVAQIADRVMVMQRGKIREIGPVLDVFESPKDNYTKELLDAVPQFRMRVWNDSQ